MKQRYNCT